MARKSPTPLEKNVKEQKVEKTSNKYDAPKIVYRSTKKDKMRIG